MGIIIDLTARTVTGLDASKPLTIQAMNETTIGFGSYLSTKEGISTFNGTIDRLTGDMAATSTLWLTTTTSTSIWNYSLKCKPTQRMFLIGCPSTGSVTGTTIRFLSLSSLGLRLFTQVAAALS